MLSSIPANIYSYSSSIWSLQEMWSPVDLEWRAGVAVFASRNEMAQKKKHFDQSLARFCYLDSAVAAQVATDGPTRGPGTRCSAFSSNTQLIKNKNQQLEKCHVLEFVYGYQRYGKSCFEQKAFFVMKIIWRLTQLGCHDLLSLQLPTWSRYLSLKTGEMSFSVRSHERSKLHPRTNSSATEKLKRIIVYL